jgi:hypothetical protein
MKFERPHEFHDDRLEITRLEVPIYNKLDQIGDVIEDLLRHDIPIQCHPPLASFPEDTPKRKREVSGGETKKGGSPVAKVGKDKRPNKRRASAVNLEDVSMSGCE